ncbi:hypothetical protein ACVIGA_000824 [Bradyrhizobium sp. USDA 3240]
MTTDVPLLTDIQDACQLGTSEYGSKINGFSATSHVPDAAARVRLADFLATPMISCASQHQRPRPQS